MTPLALDAPLASLLAVAGMTQEALAQACEPKQSKQAVTEAAARGDRIKLSTLAAYARAAELRLYLQARRSYVELSCAVHIDLDVTVAGARALLEELGLEMTLAVELVEPAERSG